MCKTKNKSKFKARLLTPKHSDSNHKWAFIILPKDVSSTLPRRGRTTVVGKINNYEFIALLEPDGKKSHWLRIEEQLLTKAGAVIGEVEKFEINPIDQEPEPHVPADLLTMLANSPKAKFTWDATTTIARVDWIHWITSAKQAKTRVKRIKDAKAMLTAGKKRVCCFDSSGFYSKAFGSPQIK